MNKILIVLVILILLVFLYVLCIWNRNNVKESLENKMNIVAKGVDSPELRKIMVEKTRDPEEIYIQQRANTHIYGNEEAARRQFYDIVNTFIEVPERTVQMNIFNLDTMLENMQHDVGLDIPNDIMFLITEPVREANIEHIVRNDPENVHDSNVQDQLSQKYKRVKQLNKNISTGTDDSINEILSIFTDKEMKNGKAPTVFNRMLNNNDRVSKLDNDYEKDILINIWKRINHPHNTENRTQLIDSFKDAINDCYKDGSTVCISGRTARILDSLTLLDNDPIINDQLKTNDLIKKEILDRSHVIVKNSLDNMSKEDKDIYEGTIKDPILSQRLPEIEDHLKTTLRNTLETEYKDIIKPDKLERLIIDASYGV